MFVVCSLSLYSSCIPSQLPKSRTNVLPPGQPAPGPTLQVGQPTSRPESAALVRPSTQPTTSVGACNRCIQSKRSKVFHSIYYNTATVHYYCINMYWMDCYISLTIQYIEYNVHCTVQYRITVKL